MHSLQSLFRYSDNNKNFCKFTGRVSLKQWSSLPNLVKFNPRFTDENATCMIVGENIFVMLLVDKFFKTFTKKDISDTSKNTEVIVALAVESREKVDQVINMAVGSGGREHKEPQDHGWMYGRGFEDINGHLWEIIYMDESALKNDEKPS